MPLTETAKPSSRKHTVVPEFTAATGPGERAVDVSHIFDVTSLGAEYLNGREVGRNAHYTSKRFI